MNLYSIETGLFKLDGGAMYGVVPKSIWNKLNPADENNLCTWAMRCLLIEFDDKLILIDTGLGNKQSEKFFSHYQPHGLDSLDSSLKKHGFHKDDITDVILTHLHFDHCGGAIERVNEIYQPTFKNAKYWSNENHWQWAIEPNPREKASFLKENIIPIQESGQLNFIKKNELLYDKISFEWVNGHTESMMLPIVEYKGSQIMFGADFLPSASHIPLAYVMAYDTRPLISMQEKSVLMEKCFDNKRYIFLEHDKEHELISLKKDDNGKIVCNEIKKLCTFATY